MKIITAGKCILVAALMSYVFYSIQWRDSMVTRHPGEATETVMHGIIVGAWDAPEITFAPRSAGSEYHTVIISPGLQSDGSKIEVIPGFFTYLRNIKVRWFALGAMCYFFTMIFSAARWWWLMHANHLRVSIHEALRFTWIGAFFNNVVPGQTGGDLVKSVYIMKRCPDRRVAALFSVIVDRILGMVALTLLGAIVVLPFLDRFQSIALAVWGVLASMLLGAAVLVSRRARRALRFDRIFNKLPTRIKEALGRVEQAIGLYRSRFIGLVLWMIGSMFNHALAVTGVVLIGYALGVGLPWIEYFVLVPVINLVSAIPIAPNGWGVGEALYGQLFGQYGAEYISGASDPEQVMRTRGVALSILFRVHITMWSMLGGILVLFEKNKVTQRDIEAEVDLERQEETNFGQDPSSTNN